MNVFILNSSILPTFGVFSYKEITVEEAKKIVHNFPFISAIGHESTAEILSFILEVKIPFNRTEISMDVRDQAIIFKLKNRLPEGKILSIEELKNLSFSLGLLTRIE